jgi:hypothetical protein
MARAVTVMALAVASTLASLAAADVYMHNPRGNNDRCDEASNNRNNDQRMFNSNNNAAGGYSWCPNEMVFYSGTVVRLEWYSQHACGNGASNVDDPSNPTTTHCEQIWQVGCQDTFQMFAGTQQATYNITDGISLGRSCADRPAQEGCSSGADQEAFNTFGNTCTERAPTTMMPLSANAPECPTGFADNAACNTDLSQGVGTFNSDTCKCSTRKRKTYGYNEPENWYHMCRIRQRNRGLFIADQNPNSNNGAQNTRQEPNSARYGFECTEERDYWPYWHPTPWKDIVVFTSNTSLCDSYTSNSQNVASKCMCVGNPADPNAQSANLDNAATTVDRFVSSQPTAWMYNRPSDCQSMGFTWKCFSSWNWEKPACLLAAQQTDNRLGNVSPRGNPTQDYTETFAYYDWTVPENLIPSGQNTIRCTLRLRYNISTSELDRNTDATRNRIIRNNPVRTYGDALNAAASTQTVLNTLPVRMAINTAQYGRTFQDRSYVFVVARRSTLPSNVPQDARIYNINVRGKRGNIAQVRNCVEYDFVPKEITVLQGDWIHFQWCGSDYNNKGNAGEGRAGTDRSNVVMIAGAGLNLPYSINSSASIFSSADTVALAYINQNPLYCYNTQQALTTNANSNQDPLSCHYLNGPRTPGLDYMPTPYFSRLVQVQNAGSFDYMSSRNNNFSNRSQKATIIANPSGLSTAAIVGAVIGTLAGVAIIGGLSYAFYTGKISFSNKITSRV